LKNFEGAVFRYRLALREPLRLAGQTLTHREGLLLRLTDRSGVCGWGEAAPLPGFSRETLEEAEAELVALCRSEELEWKSTAPSVGFACRGFFLNYTAQHFGHFGPPELYPGRARVLGVQALLAGDETAMLARARELRESAATCPVAKLKVGDVDGAAAAERVARVAETLGPGWRLRLDANRAWDFPDALAFWNAVEGLPVDYVEEPLREWRRLPELRQRCGMPIALDESLREDKVPDPVLGCAMGWVYKPTMMHEDRLVEFLDNSECVGPVTTSACFESGVGLSMLAWDAFFVDPDNPAGLDTYHWLAEDVLEERLPLAPGEVDLEALAAAARRVDLRKLERVF